MRDGYRNFYCPTCENVRRLPSTGHPDDRPYCLHHAGNYMWRKPHPETDATQMLFHEDVFIKLDDALLTTQVCASDGTLMSAVRDLLMTDSGDDWEVVSAEKLNALRALLGLEDE